MCIVDSAICSVKYCKKLDANSIAIYCKQYIYYYTIYPIIPTPSPLCLLSYHPYAYDEEVESEPSDEEYGEDFEDVGGLHLDTRNSSTN